MNYYTNEKRAERVAIAQDALKWLKAGALIARKGAYVIARNNVGDMYVDDDTQLRDVNLGVCQVCAKGALFLAKAVRYDNVFVPKYASCLEDMAADDYSGPLTEHFSQHQLQIIERAFEGWNPRTGDWYNSNASGPYVGRWVTKYPDVKDRLTAILNNIVDNNGTFCYSKV